MWWILYWVRGVQVVPSGPWGLMPASHQTCVEQDVPCDEIPSWSSPEYYCWVPS